MSFFLSLFTAFSLLDNWLCLTLRNTDCSSEKVFLAIINRFQPPVAQLLRGRQWKFPNKRESSRLGHPKLKSHLLFRRFNKSGTDQCRK